MEIIVPNTSILRKVPFSLSAKAVQVATVATVVVLVGVGGFGLGRLTGLEEVHQKVGVYAAAALGATVVPLTPEDGRVYAEVPQAPADPVAKNFVGSKNGTKFYPAGCKAASRVKPVNQVWFATAADALASGFSLASGCKTTTN